MSRHSTSPAQFVLMARIGLLTVLGLTVGVGTAEAEAPQVLLPTGSDVTIAGPATRAYADQVQNAGDFNGDGIDDIVVGAPGNGKRSLPQAGSAYVIFGGSSLRSFSIADTAAMDARGIRIDGAEDDRFGTEVAGIGDFDGDGYDDIAVSTPGYDFGAAEGGAVWVIYGGSNPSNIDLANASSTSGRVTLYEGTRAFGFLGGSVAGAGDFNADGRSDIVVGEHGFRADMGDPDQAWNGRAYVINGRVSRPARISVNSQMASAGAATVIEGARSELFGWSVSSAGDVDGDGRSDIIVGAPGASPFGRREAGAAFVVRGANITASLSAWALATRGVLVAGANGATVDAAFGSNVAGVGDLNGDGNDDVAVGAPGYLADGGDRGQLLILHGSSTLLPVDASQPNPQTTTAQFDLGYSNRPVVGLGDLTGDGKDDLGIAEYFETTQLGEAVDRFSVLGGSSGSTGASAGGQLGQLQFEVRPADPGSQGLAATISTGDFNGDGRRDIVFGSDGVASSNTAGRIDLLLGRSKPTLSYNAPVELKLGKAAAAVDPRLSGAVGTPAFEISPQLPAGLAFNSVTGRISGTPAATTSLKEYTVKASTVWGVATAVLKFRVVAEVTSGGFGGSVSVGTGGGDSTGGQGVIKQPCFGPSGVTALRPRSAVIARRGKRAVRVRFVYEAVSATPGSEIVVGLATTVRGKRRRRADVRFLRKALSAVTVLVSGQKITTLKPRTGWRSGAVLPKPMAAGLVQVRLTPRAKRGYRGRPADVIMLEVAPKPCV